MSSMLIVDVVGVIDQLLLAAEHLIEYLCPDFCVRKIEPYRFDLVNFDS